MAVLEQCIVVMLEFAITSIQGSRKIGFLRLLWLDPCRKVPAEKRLAE
jgi:hypothetical protein